MLGLTEDLGWPELECRAAVDGGRAAEVVEARGECNIQVIRNIDTKF
jgi:hypothetical protein